MTELRCSQCNAPVNPAAPDSPFAYDYDPTIEAELDACKFLLKDPRVRALFAMAPGDYVLGSCSGPVHGGE